MNPIKRRIRWGYPSGGGLGVGDTFLFTPVCRQADVIWQMPVDSFCASDLGSILSSVAQVEYVIEPIKEDESLAEYQVLYGRTSANQSPVNAAQGYLNRYGLNIKDCIPEARPPAHEVDWAYRWLACYRSPIVFTPMPGGFNAKDNSSALAKWIPPENWTMILKNLSKNHDILYFTARDNYVYFPYTKPLLGFSLAKISAIQYVTKRHLGVENGLLHMAVAMGATCWVGIPTKNLNQHTFVPYLYADNLWGNKINRVSYAPITKQSDFARDLTFTV